MDFINQRFQTLLEKRRFPLQIEETEECFIYKGGLEVSRGRVIEFAVSLEKKDTYAVGQIVFNHLIAVSDESDAVKAYQVVNTLNQSQGLYYYFVVDSDYQIFARYVAMVSEVDTFFHILLKGVEIIPTAIFLLDEQLLD